MRKCLMCHKRNMDGYGICESCKQLNREMQAIHTDLTGYTALVTGGRIKIGYATALRLLRDGAKVIVVTRYPYDALDRYSKERDYETFKKRLVIYGFNLMCVNKLDELLHFIYETVPGGLDILVNNAAQTIKKADSYYLQLENREQQMKLLYQENESCQLVSQNTVDKQRESMLIPSAAGLVQKEESPMYNSWVAKAQDISVQEMLEVQLVNVTAPFILVGQLKELMVQSPRKNKFIINVSSVEGKFNRKKKLARHVHTNMAKASLNMMTLSLAMEYEKERIFMYSVDPGWVSNQFPSGYNASLEFQQYLTFEDAASRICHPIYTKLQEDVIKDAGSLLKDYKIIEY